MLIATLIGYTCPIRTPRYFYSPSYMIGTTSKPAPTPLFFQYAELLHLYRDLDLALHCNPDVGEHNKVEFARNYLKSKITEQNAPWLTPYLHQELAIKKKGFFSYMLSDYDRMLRVAFILSEMKDDTDAHRLTQLVGTLKGKMVTAFPDDEEHSAVKDEPTLYLQRGLFSIEERELSRIKAKAKLTPEQKVHITVIAHNATTFHFVLESLASFGWVYTPPRFSKGEKLQFSLSIDHSCQQLHYMQEIGATQQSRYKK